MTARFDQHVFDCSSKKKPNDLPKNRFVNASRSVSILGELEWDKAFMGRTAEASDSKRPGRRRTKDFHDIIENSLSKRRVKRWARAGEARGIEETKALVIDS